MGEGTHPSTMPTPGWAKDPKYPKSFGMFQGQMQQFPGAERGWGREKHWDWGRGKCCGTTEGTGVTGTEMEGNRGEMLPDHNAPRGNALGLGCSRKCDGAGAQ